MTTLSPNTENMLRALAAHEGGVYEILYYKKNGHGIWLQQDVTPIKNEQDTLVLFLVSFRDITAFREPLPGGGMMTNLSKFAKLAWTMTRSRQQQQQAAAEAMSAARRTPVPAVGDGPITTDSNLTPNVNHVSKSSNLDQTVPEIPTNATVMPPHGQMGNSTAPPPPETANVNSDKQLQVRTGPKLLT